MLDIGHCDVSEVVINRVLEQFMIFLQASNPLDTGMFRSSRIRWKLSHGFCLLLRTAGTPLGHSEQLRLRTVFSKIISSIVSCSRSSLAIRQRNLGICNILMLSEWFAFASSCFSLFWISRFIFCSWPNIWLTFVNLFLWSQNIVSLYPIVCYDWDLILLKDLFIAFPNGSPFVRNGFQKFEFSSRLYWCIFCNFFLHNFELIFNIHHEFSAFAYLTEDLQCAAHSLDQLLTDRQSQTCAGFVSSDTVAELAKIHEQLGKSYYTDASISECQFLMACSIPILGTVYTTAMHLRAFYPI